MVIVTNDRHELGLTEFNFLGTIVHETLRGHTGIRRYACLIVHICSAFKVKLGKVYMFLKLRLKGLL